jgi:hypothetical protein
MGILYRSCYLRSVSYVQQYISLIITNSTMSFSICFLTLHINIPEILYYIGLSHKESYISKPVLLFLSSFLRFPFQCSLTAKAVRTPCSEPRIRKTLLSHSLIPHFHVQDLLKSVSSFHGDKCYFLTVLYSASGKHKIKCCMRQASVICCTLYKNKNQYDINLLFFSQSCPAY